MSKSPGHRKHPEHQIREFRIGERMQIKVGNDLVADSHDVLKVEEDSYPDRYYFPRTDIRMDVLERSDTTTTCPFKGTAHYFHLHAGGKRLKDAVWTYEDPYDEHAALKDRLAFYTERSPAVELDEAVR
jgi:uncharacterized protein (DUF427 family)